MRKGRGLRNPGAGRQRTRPVAKKRGAGSPLGHNANNRPRKKARDDRGNNENVTNQAVDATSNGVHIEENPRGSFKETHTAKESRGENNRGVVCSVQGGAFAPDTGVNDTQEGYVDKDGSTSDCTEDIVSRRRSSGTRRVLGGSPNARSAPIS